MGCDASGPSVISYRNFVDLSPFGVALNVRLRGRMIRGLPDLTTLGSGDIGSLTDAVVSLVSSRSIVDLLRSEQL